MRLKEYVSLEAILKLKSGLHIGAATTKEIGKGEPLPVMKSLINGSPYIPGSSLKGKMRCLFEMVYGKTSNGGPCECGECQICLLFGSGNAKTTFEPSRLIFRDIYLTKKSAETIEKLGLETKPGVSIDRNTGKARGHSLFPIERIPAESEFDFIISCRIFESDDKESIRKWLGVGLYLLELDALGSGGTRGSGYIEFVNIVFDGQPFDENWREEAKSIKDSLLKQVKIKKI